MPEPKHLGLHRVGREPVQIADPDLGAGRAWFHVHCIMDGPQAPVAVALTREGVMAGDRVNPGDFLDVLSGASGVWLCGPKDGQAALVSVERRLAATYATRTLLGELVTMTSWKSSGEGVELVPGEWANPWTNVLGLGFGALWVSGPGPAWVGTQVDTRQPPPPSVEAMKTTGGLFPIQPGAAPLLLPGNPNLHATAYERGVRLHLFKIAGGRQFGEGVWPLKEGVVTNGGS